MKTKIVFVVLAFMLALTPLQATDKSSAIGQILSVIQDIHSIASQKSLSPDQAKASIQKRIDGVSDPELLVKIAVISSTIAYPGDAGDQSFDNCFFDAFWICVQRLSSLKGRVGADALDEIKRMVPLDGGDKLSLDAFIAKQKGEKPVY